jgi:RDD family/GYF domain 2
MANWWYLDGRNKTGPVPFQELQHLLESGAIGLRTVVWKGDEAECRPLVDFEEFAAYGAKPADVRQRLASSFRATAWPRFFARHLDLYWEMLFLAFIGGLLLGPLVDTEEWIVSGSSYLLFVLIIPFSLGLDAVVHGLFGTTPGKRLLGLTVRRLGNGRLTTRQHLLRNFRVWASGLAFGVPVFTLGTYYFQWTRLARGVPTSYDTAAEVQVVGTPLRPWRKLAVGLAFLGVWAFFTTVLVGERHLTAHLREAKAARRTVSWENALTGVKAKLEGRWQASAQKSPEGQPLFVFTEPTEQVIAILGEEKLELPLKDYVLAFQKATASTMHFTDAGQFATGDRPSWSASGAFQLGNMKGRFDVQVIQFGSNFWRVITVRALQSTIPDETVARLQAAVWSTVK